MKNSEHIKYSKKVLEVLGIEKINNLHQHQEQSLNNQLQDLLDAHNNVVETITDDEIIGRYELVTKHIYSDDFVDYFKHQI